MYEPPVCLLGHQILRVLEYPGANKGCETKGKTVPQISQAVAALRAAEETSSWTKFWLRWLPASTLRSMEPTRAATISTLEDLLGAGLIETLANKDSRLVAVLTKNIDPISFLLTEAGVTIKETLQPKEVVPEQTARLVLS